MNCTGLHKRKCALCWAGRSSDVYKRQMYERDGLPLEKVLKNIIRTRFLYPRVQPYKTENFYALLSARKEAQPIAKQQKGRKARRQKA